MNNNILKPIQPQKIFINSLHRDINNNKLKCLFYYVQQLNSLILKESNGHVGIVAFLLRKNYSNLTLCLMLGIHTSYEIGTMWYREDLISYYKDEFIFLFENPNDYFNGFWKICFQPSYLLFNDDFECFSAFKIKEFGGGKLKQIMENYSKTFLVKNLNNFLK